MGLRSFIPGRDGFWQGQFGRALSVAAEDGDVLLEVEWPNGQLTFEPAQIDEEQNRYICKNGMTFYSRGKGSDPKLLAGQPVIHVRAENAGVISTYHALMSTAVSDGDAIPVDENGNELVDEDGEPLFTPEGEPANPELAADGGALPEPADFIARTPGNCYGREYSLAESSYHDPEPVSQEDAKRAVEWAEVSGKDPGEVLRYIAYGVGFGLIPIILMVILLWILGQLGGGGGGGSVINLALAGWFV